MFSCWYGTGPWGGQGDRGQTDREAVGKVQRDKCARVLPGGSRAPPGEQQPFRMEASCFVIYSFILCLIFLLPVLLAMKLSQPPVMLMNCVPKKQRRLTLGLRGGKVLSWKKEQHV